MNCYLIDLEAIDRSDPVEYELETTTEKKKKKKEVKKKKKKGTHNLAVQNQGEGAAGECHATECLGSKFHHVKHPSYVGGQNIAIQNQGAGAAGK